MGCGGLVDLTFHILHLSSNQKQSQQISLDKRRPQLRVFSMISKPKEAHKKIAGESEHPRLSLGQQRRASKISVSTQRCPISCSQFNRDKTQTAFPPPFPKRPGTSQA